MINILCPDMKHLSLLLVAILCALVMMTGCTSQTSTNPVTTVPTAVQTVVETVNPTEIPTSVPTLVTDPELLGTWYLKLMSEQNGTAQVQMINPQITVIFDEQNISGFSGCNNYNGQYKLTGETLPNGKGIAIGPLAMTMMYCADSATTETTYMQILQSATSYTVNVNKELSITDNSNNALVYQRTPYGQDAVPKGS